MLLLAATTVALGVGTAAYGLARTKAIVASGATPVDLALGRATEPPATGEPGLLFRAVEPLLVTGGRLVGRVSPKGRLDLIRRRLLYAGMEGRVRPERVLSWKAAAAAGGLAIGLLLGSPGSIPKPVWAIGIAVMCSFLPDIVLSSRGTKRQGEVAKTLSQAIDLLAITVEAGLGLEQALEVVVENIRGPLAEELARLVREIELGVSRRDALVALRHRTDVAELSSFVVALIQADEMGVAIAEVLRVQAVQVRMKRRARAREKGAKTPVKILFPLLIGVFPAIFVVTVGPGAIQIARAFAGR
ncbi:MAG: type II secretion system F family protein [Acidimicrobiales bacterium]